MTSRAQRVRSSHPPASARHHQVTQAEERAGAAQASIRSRGESHALDQRAHGHQTARIRGRSKPLPRGPYRSSRDETCPVSTPLPTTTIIVAGHARGVTACRLRIRTPRTRATRPARCRDDPVPPARVAGERHFRAAQRDRDRNAQPAAQQRGRIAFRIGEMGIDNVERETSA